MPAYAALGNDDTCCGDYKLNADSAFLAQAKAVSAVALPAAGRAQAEQEFKSTGSYSVQTAAPMRRTRMIVLNELVIPAEAS